MALSILSTHHLLPLQLRLVLVRPSTSAAAAASRTWPCTSARTSTRATWSVHPGSIMTPSPPPAPALLPPASFAPAPVSCVLWPICPCQHMRSCLLPPLLLLLSPVSYNHLAAASTCAPASAKAMAATTTSTPLPARRYRYRKTLEKDVNYNIVLSSATSAAPPTRQSAGRTLQANPPTVPTRRGRAAQSARVSATCLFTRPVESSLVPAGFLTAQFL